MDGGTRTAASSLKGEARVPLLEIVTPWEPRNSKCASDELEGRRTKDISLNRRRGETVTVKCAAKYSAHHALYTPLHHASCHVDSMEHCLWSAR